MPSGTLIRFCQQAPADTIGPSRCSSRHQRHAASFPLGEKWENLMVSSFQFWKKYDLLCIYIYIFLMNNLILCFYKYLILYDTDFFFQGIQGLDDAA